MPEGGPYSEATLQNAPSMHPRNSATENLEEAMVCGRCLVKVVIARERMNVRLYTRDFNPEHARSSPK